MKIFEVHEFKNSPKNSPINKAGKTFSLNELTEMDISIVESTTFKIISSSPEFKFIQIKITELNEEDQNTTML